MLLLTYQMKGVISNQGSDMYFGDYLKLILDAAFLKIKSIPPFKRKQFELRSVIDYPNEVKKEEKDFMQPIRSMKDDNPFKRATTHFNKVKYDD